MGDWLSPRPLGLHKRVTGYHHAPADVITTVCLVVPMPQLRIPENVSGYPHAHG
jgi:hypothetical protein